MTPRVFLIQLEGVKEKAARDAELQTSAAWLSGILPRLKKIPPLSDFVTSKVPPRTAEEHSLELQAQMRVTREFMAEQGKIRTWAEWQAGS